MITVSIEHMVLLHHLEREFGCTQVLPVLLLPDGFLLRLQTLGGFVAFLLQFLLLPALET